MLNVERISASGQKAVKDNKKVSFNGKYSLGDITSKVDSYMPRGVKGIKKLSNNLGEVQNIIINALGTGLIAPFFIKYNPLSKTDEDTRTYSAWRQPISAVLAIATQVAAIIPFNRFLNEAFNVGALGDEYNKSAFKDEAVLRREIKRANPNFTKAQIDKAVKDAQKAQEETLLKNIREKNSVEITKYKKNGKFTLNKKLFDTAVGTTIDDLIAGEKKEQTRLLNEKREYRIRRREFYRTHNKETIDYMSEIDEILKKDDIKTIRKELKAKIKSLKKSADKKELKLITEEILGLIRSDVPDVERLEFIRLMQEKSDKVKRVARNYAPDKMPDKDAVIKAIDAELKPRLTSVDDTVKFLEKVKAEIAKGKTVKEIEEMFELEMKKNSRLKQKGINFVKDVAETLKSQIKGNTNSVKQMGGLILGLIMLPITCTLLNKVYPVFMDKFFPEISNKHKEKKKQEELKNVSLLNKESGVANG